MKRTSIFIRLWVVVPVAGLATAWGCRADSVLATDDSAGPTESGDESTETGDSGVGDESGTETGDDGGLPKLDVGPGDGDGDACGGDDDMEGIGECTDVAPPDSFEPTPQWKWWGEGTWIESDGTPLVVNLTDDDDNGTVDLCDTPDVVVMVREDFAESDGHLFVLDGATGEVHFVIDDPLAGSGTPAVGDIDGDGSVEIVTFGTRDLRAYASDGTLLWATDFPGFTTLQTPAVALADVDNDGDAEIAVSHLLYDHEGNLLFHKTGVVGSGASATVLADLDGDGDQEVVYTRSAFHHDGTPLYELEGDKVGFPQVANLDDDPQPEILVVGAEGISLYDHDGTAHYVDQKPLDLDPPAEFTWGRPATIHDFDGDGQAEFAVSAQNAYSAFEAAAPMPTALWSAEVADLSGSAAGTAFDFLGDGTPEAMYADEDRFYAFDNAGQTLLQVQRSSGTIIEYPVVADVDNDGSAEVLLTSTGSGDFPALQVIREVESRWIQARRVWNQHTYHVTNVREDGTIPQFEVPHWEELNTFRTNAQIEGGVVCEPAG